MEHERILHILEYLTRFTNSGRTATIQDIRAYLAEHYSLQSVSALTIRRDLDRLITAGYDIRITHGAHNTAQYSLHTRSFSFNEIRFIVDSVSINKFISERKKRQMLRKFESFCSEEELRRLDSRIVLNGPGTPSTDLLDNLEKVHDLISQKRKINFEYGKFDVSGQMKFYQKSREMIPCRVVYSRERFYLKCVDEQTGAERTYRIDRMRHITPGGKISRRPQLSRPDGAVLGMFPPEQYVTVTLRVIGVLLDDMLEHLEKYASVRKDPDPAWVQIQARIGISPDFYRWAMEYGANLEVLAPENIREEMAEKLRQALQLYAQSSDQK
ncbi:MAG: WYL domain-containing protein [Oscillospiraceae bacterium]|nr:WYL domain-containing protein [Oscillospiraceae bacterium]